ncbi:hypothetical protein C1I98_01265 [Spongiactinospora gelatinilytica]|uniref:Uncharacterized protein n=2 Tax=Spongiactinospora gelatinilytica TaxID=2666298 RepID=A0A2W2H7A9_9ACTN|nr:hypothetical protein C1I98_01265 [Spongiactinospora gelatinilytica]
MVGLRAADELGWVRPRTPMGTLSMLSFLTDYGPDQVRRLIMDYRARAAEPGFRPRLGPPEFESAARAAVTAPDPWQALHEALESWRPLNDDHIAPISLLADPQIAPLITPDLGRRILSTPRGRDRKPTSD